MGMMKAARLHRIGTHFSIDEITRPEPRANDVLVQVKRAGSSPT